MKTMRNIICVLATAVLCPQSASAIAFTITEDSDALLTGTFQSQFPLSSSRRGSDSGTFESKYWSGSLSFLCTPDMGSYISFVPTFSVKHTPSGSGLGTALKGDYESISSGFGSFVFQPFSWYPGNGDWFVVSGSYGAGSASASASGTFRVTRPVWMTLPDNGSSVALISLALGTLLLAGKTVFNAPSKHAPHPALR